jgi:hypothetical protein
VEFLCPHQVGERLKKSYGNLLAISKNLGHEVDIRWANEIHSRRI